MRAIFNLVAAGATAAAFIAAVSLPATAACKRYGFTVNDYGKDGPTKDAKSLLDKMIATKMSEQGIKDFHTGKKSVSCDLFLNFIVFDEHTCTAQATVCWGGSQLPKSEETAAADDAAGAEPQKAAADASEPNASKKKDVAKKPESAAEKKKSANVKTIADPKKPVEHAQHTSAPSEASAKASVSPSEAAPSNEAPTADAAAKPEHSTHSAKPVETGSLNDEAKKPAHHNKEKAAPESNDGPPVKLDNADGYPTPEAPQQDGAQ
ncbi:MAG: hypothetical protein WC026_11740 [Hyphomicrobium sp.]|uniref:hypothetical protein n=1 Tax=Hyphomicrobium sp. TaxID=82 RepID=UPI003565741E